MTLRTSTAVIARARARAQVQRPRIGRVLALGGPLTPRAHVAMLMKTSHAILYGTGARKAG